MLSLTPAQQEQIRLMDKFLFTLDPIYVEKMFEQLRIMGVLKEGSSGDINFQPYEVFSEIIDHLKEQESAVSVLQTEIMDLKTDMVSVAKLIHALIPPEPRDVRITANGEYSFFNKHGLRI